MDLCSFCSKLEDETLLIELSSNQLRIGKCYYDFSYVFNDLFRITSDDLKSNFICEPCKDSIVEFFAMKRNVVGQMNQHRKMILSQVDDFMSQANSIEEIQVVRKMNSVTLLVDANESPDIKTPLEIIEQPEYQQENQEQDFDYDDDELMDDQEMEIEAVELQLKKEEDVIEDLTSYIQCQKCEEALPNFESSEIHEFFKHSLIGLQIENETENCQENIYVVEGETTFVRTCATCLMDFEDLTAYTAHLVVNHVHEVQSNINDLFTIDTAKLNLDAINKYIDYIKDLLQSNETRQELDEESKKCYFEVYSGDTIKQSEDIEEIVNEEIEEFVNEEIEEVANDSEQEENLTVEISENSMERFENQARSEKRPVNLSDSDRVWLRKEITSRKKLVLNEFGTKRAVYQCAYCNEYSSNSAPGFRYHLTIRHLKDSHCTDLIGTEISGAFRAESAKASKNVCVECNLKFRDKKQFTLHHNCHSSFNIIAYYYLFPTCSTCDKLFIDDRALATHLEQHNSNGDIQLPIRTERVGACVEQGKQLLMNPVEVKGDEISEGDLAWRCGHCTMTFSKEASCRFHLLLTHVFVFVCPIDKREFSGFKAVSLFTHHIKNKHSELFPELTFTCTFCKMNFPSIYDKLSHMKSCSLKKFTCDHCGKKFFKKCDLTSHLRFISGELFFPCATCGKKCETRSDLKIHLRSHTKEKPFDCPVCNKTFRTLAARSAHTESHNTDAQYTCYCGKTFKQRQMYRRHMKAVHENDSRKNQGEDSQ